METLEKIKMFIIDSFILGVLFLIFKKMFYDKPENTDDSEINVKIPIVDE